MTTAIGDDELLQALDTYRHNRGGHGTPSRKKHRGRASTGACRRMRRAAEARVEADAAVAHVIFADDIRAVLTEPFLIATFEQLIDDAIIKLGKYVWHIGALVDYLAVLLLQESKRVSWEVHDIYARLLIPTLADLRAEKTKSFGIVFYLVKALYAAKDWPSKNEMHNAALRKLVQSDFLNARQSDLLTAVWLDCHLGLKCFDTFESLFASLCNSDFIHIQALRLYCTHASPDLQYNVVQKLTDCAMATPSGERRKYFLAACDLITRFNLDRSAFPDVARYKLRCWLCYIVHRVPVETVEDYTNGEADLLSLCVQQLVRAENLSSAALLYKRNKDVLDFVLDDSVLSQLQHNSSIATSVPDIFAPHQSDGMKLSLGEDAVHWIDSVSNTSVILDTLRAAPIIGIDLEWSSLGDWMVSSLALMQLATPTQVFLVDLAKKEMVEAIASIFKIIMGSEEPLLVGFAFHNDLRELSTSPWASVCKDVHGFCDLQLISGKPNEGLSGLVQRVLLKPLCKVEQRSYWHRRPLRRSQRHYAALDAFVLLQVASGLTGVSLSEPSRLAAKLRTASLLN